METWSAWRTRLVGAASLHVLHASMVNLVALDARLDSDFRDT
jgi:hypothetical protein